MDAARADSAARRAGLRRNAAPDGGGWGPDRNRSFDAQFRKEIGKPREPHGGDVIMINGGSCMRSDDEAPRLFVPKDGGVYTANRAASISGVPLSTVHYWARNGPLQPSVSLDKPKLHEGCREWHRAYSSLNPQKGKSSMYSPTLPGLFSLLATSHSVLLRSCVLRASSRFQLG